MHRFFPSLLLALALLLLGGPASAQCDPRECPPLPKPDATIAFDVRAGIGGQTVPLPERELNDIVRALDEALDLVPVADRPGKMGMTYGLTRNGELIVGVTSDDLRMTPGRHPIIRVGHGPVDNFEDPLLGIWGTGNVGFDDPLFGFDDPRLGFDDPLFGFDDPLLGFDDPLFGIWGTGNVGFDDPLFGFDDPIIALSAVWAEARDQATAEYSLVLISYPLHGNRHHVRGSAVVVPFDLVDGARLHAPAPPAQAVRSGAGLSAYPNPFNPATVLTFETAQDGPARLAVYDLLGREVAVLVRGVTEAGRHEVRFDASTLPSGTYLVRLEAGAHVRTQRLTLLR